ncbi:MAG: HAD-IC family P-type ATPase, partial [Clostridium sp.]
TIHEVGLEEIVKDDIVFLSVGDQILADGVIVQGDELEVDESMLTGEADPIAKNEGGHLLSGSFVVSGEGYFKVTKVGAETYTSKLADEARAFKVTNSELQSSMNKILKVLICIIIPLGILLTVSQLFFTQVGWRESVIGTVSGIIGMVPEGLVLLTSATFIVAIIKLGEHKTLVQELSATEVLARVDMLCLDKTGTITEGALKLVDVVNVGNRSKEEIDEVLTAIAHNLPSKNPTQEAILMAYKEGGNLEVIEKKPFSSARKWGGVKIKDSGVWALGAPEIICKDCYDSIREQVEVEAERGRRVLLLAKIDDDTISDGISGDVENVALILIEDIIREEAPETLKYFREEGVDIKVISGDNPITVAAVAKRAGLLGAEKYVDARTLPSSGEELAKVIDNYTVFGRVTPHQKKDIVKALQKSGHTVAMTGDGVNDVLALKEADCGIAMANGSDATKAVAQLVLLNSNFSALPKVVAEGRRQINNLERVAQLFLSKTVYSIILAFVFALFMLPFPILPIQMSLVGSCAIGIPAFFLALGPNNDRVEKNFLHRILSTSLPSGIILAIFTITGFVTSYLSGMPIERCRTLALLMLSGVSMVILIKVSLPVSKFKLGLVLGMIFLVALAFVTPIGRHIFSLSRLTLSEVLITAGFIVLSWPILNFASGLNIHKFFKSFR